MRITAADYSIVFLDGADRTYEAQSRTAKIPHVSHIIRDISKRHGQGKKRGTSWDDEVSQGFLERMADSGFAFEGLLRDAVRMKVPTSGGELVSGEPLVITIEMAMELAWKRRMRLRRRTEGNIVQPGELELDGLAGNPDGLNLDEEANEEYKHTWKSMAKMPQFRVEFAEWDWQMRAYLHMERSLGLLPYGQIAKSILIVRWVNGDYRSTGYRPVDKAYNIEYSADEIESNWRMITQHRDWMRKEGLIK